MLMLVLLEDPVATAVDCVGFVMELLTFVAMISALLLTK